MKGGKTIAQLRVNPSHATLNHLFFVQLVKVNGVPSSAITFLECSHSELTPEHFKGQSVDAIIGEPYFSSSLLPWHNLHFWYAISSLRKIVAPEPERCVVIPGKGLLKAIAGMFKCVVTGGGCYFEWRWNTPSFLD